MRDSWSWASFFFFFLPYSYCAIKSPRHSFPASSSVALAAFFCHLVQCISNPCFFLFVCFVCYYCRHIFTLHPPLTEPCRGFWTESGVETVSVMWTGGRGGTPSRQSPQECWYWFLFLLPFIITFILLALPAGCDVDYGQSGVTRN